MINALYVQLLQILSKPDPSHLPTPLNEDITPYTDEKAHWARVTDEIYFGAERAILDTNPYRSMNVDCILSLSFNHRNADKCIPMDDGAGTSVEQIEDAVQWVEDQIEQGNRVFINCAAGISRSSTVTATVIARERDITFDAALLVVKNARERAKPHPALEETAKMYLS